MLSGETVYRDTATSEYDGEVLLYSHTTSSLKITVNYSVVVYLETGKGSVSSTPLNIYSESYSAHYIHYMYSADCYSVMFKINN